MASAKRNRQRTRRLVNEGAVTATEVRTDLIDLAEAIRSDGTLPVMLINPGWGSSGYYSPDVLEAAGIDRVFPRGTQMYIDHPSATERMDRPERSVRDLVAVLETDGIWQANGAKGPGIYAQAKVFEGWRPFIAEVGPHIGLSIRAAAEIGSGEAEGRKGRIVERLIEAVSVDFVTKAGRGGQVLEAIESHQPAAVTEAANYLGWFESRIHLDFTTRADDMYGQGVITKDERIALSTGIGAALDAFSQTVEDLAPELLTRDLWATPDSTATTTESQEDQMDTKQITEAVAEAVKVAVPAAVAEALAKANEPKAAEQADEAAKKLTDAEERAARAEGALLVEGARRHVAGNDKVKALPAVARDRLVTQVANEAKAGTDGKLDSAALDEATTAAVDAEVKYLAEATGSPVRGAGGADLGARDDKATETAEAALVGTFERLGMSEGAAKVAAGGRA